MNRSLNRRILLVDDTPTIHEDFRKILMSAATSDLEEDEALLFGQSRSTPFVCFELHSAYQGAEAVEKVKESLPTNSPYAMAFVDMRMPPGLDGVETIERLWQHDPLLQIVICTAYSDHSWGEVLAHLDVQDRLLILKKPFDAIEVYQFASALTAKWALTQQAAMKMADLEAAIRAQTKELRQTNEALTTEIADRKQLEGQLLQSEKLASIGQLAAGVAHEINNPIAFVQSNLGTLGAYLETLLNLISAYRDAEGLIDSADVVDKLGRLRKNSQLDCLVEDVPSLMRETSEGIFRVRQIVQNLRDFSRIDASPGWEMADLHKGIDATLNIVAHEIKYAADVVKEYGQVPEIECLPSQLNQVILNLMMNAAYAAGSTRGKIVVSTGSEGADKVWISVADTGCGIAKENLSRIFDPFFTTKPVGKGTGLGLSLSYGIIKKHRGSIDVQSEVGVGTTFRITLPTRQSS
jgi:two-component system NtrC family sensor kinase